MQGDIRTHISLEGAEEILQQLQELGIVGEDAMRRFGEAVEASSGSTEFFGRKIEETADFFKRGGLKDIARDFGEIGTAIAKVGKNLLSLGGQVLPPWLLTFSVVGIVAGLEEVARSAARSAHEIREHADALGMTTGQYQALTSAAKESGIEQERFNNAMFRFSRQIAITGEAAERTALSVAQILIGPTQESGTLKVLRGITQAASDFESKIVKGVVVAADSFRSRIISLTPLTASLQKFAEFTWAKIPPDAQRSLGDFNQFLFKLRTTIDETTPEAQQLRTELSKFVDVQAKTVFEELQQRMPGVRNEFARMIPNLISSTGETIKTTNALEEYIKEFNKLPGPAEKTRAVLRDFGRGMQELVTWFSDGTISVKEIEERMIKAGIALSDEQVRIGDKAHKAFIQIGNAFATLKNQFGIELSPAIREFAQILTDMLPELIPLVRSIAREIGPVITGILRSIDSLLKRYNDYKSATGSLPKIPITDLSKPAGTTTTGTLQAPSSASAAKTVVIEGGRVTAETSQNVLRGGSVVVAPGKSQFISIEPTKPLPVEVVTPPGQQPTNLGFDETGRPIGLKTPFQTAMEGIQSQSGQVQQLTQQLKQQIDLEISTARKFGSIDQTRRWSPAVRASVGLLPSEEVPIELLVKEIKNRMEKASISGERFPNILGEQTQKISSSVETLATQMPELTTDIPEQIKEIDSLVLVLNDDFTKLANNDLTNLTSGLRDWQVSLDNIEPVDKLIEALDKLTNAINTIGWPFRELADLIRSVFGGTEEYINGWTVFFGLLTAKLTGVLGLFTRISGFILKWSGKSLLSLFGIGPTVAVTLPLLTSGDVPTGIIGEENKKTAAARERGEIPPGFFNQGGALETFIRDNLINVLSEEFERFKSNISLFFGGIKSMSDEIVSIWDKFKQSWNDFWSVRAGGSWLAEKLGLGDEPLLNRIGSWITDKFTVSSVPQTTTPVTDTRTFSEKIGILSDSILKFLSKFNPIGSAEAAPLGKNVQDIANPFNFGQANLDALNKQKDIQNQVIQEQTSFWDRLGQSLKTGWDSIIVWLSSLNPIGSAKAATPTGLPNKTSLGMGDFSIDTDAIWGNFYSKATETIDRVKSYLSSLNETEWPLWNSFYDLATPAIDRVKSLITGLFDSNSGEGLWNSFVAGVGPAIDTVKNTITSSLTGFDINWSIWDSFLRDASAAVEQAKSWIDSLAQSAANLFASLGGGSSLPEVPLSSQTFATGGSVLGPSGIDKVPVWATAGEWIMQVPAVRYYGVEFMKAINSLTLPKFNIGGFIDSLLPTPSYQLATAGNVKIPKFATGGFVDSFDIPSSFSVINTGNLNTSSSLARNTNVSRTPIHLHFGNQIFEMETDEATAERVVRIANQENMRSAGRKPSWYFGKK